MAVRWGSLDSEMRKRWGVHSYRGDPLIPLAISGEIEAGQMCARGARWAVARVSRAGAAQSTRDVTESVVSGQARWRRVVTCPSGDAEMSGVLAGPRTTK